MSSFRFSYWSDPLCIWAFVAQPKLDRVLAEFGDRIAVDYRVVPVFGSVPQRFRDGSWSKQGVEGRVAATRRIAEAQGRDDVTGEGWRKMPASSWSPGASIKAVFALAEQGVIEAKCATDYQWRLRERFFLDDVNIAHRKEQLALVEACGIPTAKVEAMLDDGTALALLWEDHAEREKLGVRGSPSYVFDGGRTLFYGNFSYEPLRATIEAMVAGHYAQGSEC
ncbi:MAG: DsbA family protein [Proteobacteria bacterium]|nr:DsbA family protein [Pseudomonadota bacterium]